MMTEKEYLKAIGNRISMLRKEKGWTQIELANKLNVKRMQIYRIESGQNSLGILSLKNIADVFEVKIGDIVDDV